MRNIWFTSDTHFHHDNIISYTSRPYSNVDQMNEALIQNWNSVIRPHDVIYHLGDFAFGRGATTTAIQTTVNQLHGQINLIPGNHDKKMKGISGIHVLHPIHMIKPKVRIVMCHWPMLSWYGSHGGSWHLFGHVHGKLETHVLSLDVGVDANNYTPINLDDVIAKMSQKIIANTKTP